MDSEGGSGLVGWTALEFGIGQADAERKVRGLIHLVTGAGLDWAETTCR